MQLNKNSAMHVIAVMVVFLIVAVWPCIAQTNNRCIKFFIEEMRR